MSRVLLVEQESNTRRIVTTTLRQASHLVFTAPSSQEGLALCGHYTIDIVLTSLQLGDASGLHVIKTIRDRNPTLPVVVITGLDSTQDVVAAIRLGATDFIQKPISPEHLLQTVATAIAASTQQRPPAALTPAQMFSRQLSAHAAARWARAVVRIVDSPQDVRTITNWSTWIAASPGAVRNWCFTAGIPPRRSLVFGRMLRAVVQGQGGYHRPENLLDVVDRRTLSGLLKLAGLNGDSRFPEHVDEFLERQTLVHDRDALHELRRALDGRLYDHARAGHARQ